MILVVPGPRAVGPGSSSTRPRRPPAEPPRSGHTVAALRRSLGGDFGQPQVSGDHPQGMNCHLQPSSQAAQPDTPTHQLLNSTWHAPGSNCSRRTLTVLTRPAGHRRRARNPTRQLPRAGGPCQRGRGPPGRASPSGELVPTRQAHERRPRRPCHYRAIHSGPGWSPADNHGHRHSDLDLRRFVQSQVTNRAIWLCKQVIGLSRPRPHGGTTSRTPAACTAAPGTDRSSCSPITPRTRSPPTASPS
jgi:hypothetical protein